MVTSLAFFSYFFPPVQHSGTLRTAAFCKYLPAENVMPVIFSSSDHDVNKLNIVGHVLETEHVDDPAWGEVYRFDWKIGDAGPKTSVADFLRRVPVANYLQKRRALRRVVKTLQPDVVEKLQRRGCDAVYCTYSPEVCVELGAAAAAACQLPLIIDLRDPWTHMPTPPHRHYLDYLLARDFEAKTLRSASAIVVTTDAHKSLLMQSMAVPENRIHVIRNGSHGIGTAPDSANQYDSAYFNIAHIGTIGIEQRKQSPLVAFKKALGFDYDPLQNDYSTRTLQVFFDLAAHVASNSPSMLQRIRFTFVGVDDTERAVAAVPSDVAEFFRFLGRVPQQEAQAYAARADLLVMNQVTQTTRGTPTHVCVPAKLYDYMSTGNPILAFLHRSEMDELLKCYSAAFVCDSADAAMDFVKGAYARWEAGLPMRGSSEIAQAFDRQHQTKQLATLVRRVIEHTHS